MKWENAATILDDIDCRPWLFFGRLRSTILNRYRKMRKTPTKASRARVRYRPRVLKKSNTCLLIVLKKESRFAERELSSNWFNSILSLILCCSLVQVSSSSFSDLLSSRSLLWLMRTRRFVIACVVAFACFWSDKAVSFNSAFN